MINASDVDGFRRRPCPRAHVRALAITCAVLSVAVAVGAAALRARLYSNSDRLVVTLPQSHHASARRPGPPHLPAGNLSTVAR